MKSTSDCTKESKSRVFGKCRFGPVGRFSAIKSTTPIIGRKRKKPEPWDFGGKPAAKVTLPHESPTNTKLVKGEKPIPAQENSSSSEIQVRTMLKDVPLKRA